MAVYQSICIGENMLKVKVIEFELESSKQLEHILPQLLDRKSQSVITKNNSQNPVCSQSVPEVGEDKEETDW